MFINIDYKILELAKIESDISDIEDVYMWIMPNKTQHWKRIKISNKKHKFDKDDCFVLTIPELDIIGYRNEKTINNKTLSKIKIFITINMEYIDMFYNYELSDDEFKAILKPYYEKTI